MLEVLCQELHGLLTLYIIFKMYKAIFFFCDGI